MRVAAALLVLAAAACAAPTPAPSTAERPSPTPYGVTGRATWYGARCPQGVRYLGRRDTCSPYVSKEDGGRGGELTTYCAQGWFRYGDQPVDVLVLFVDTGKEVRCTVRDYCDACAKGRAIIDLSPVVFLAGGLTLGRGVARVSVRYLGAR